MTSLVNVPKNVKKLKPKKKRGGTKVILADSLILDRDLPNKSQELTHAEALMISNDLGLIPTNLCYVGATSNALPKIIQPYFESSILKLKQYQESSSSSSFESNNDVGVPVVGILYPLNKNDSISGKYNTKDLLPFPTTYWMTSPILHVIISKLEVIGLIDEYQKRLDNSEEFKEIMKQAHESYAKDRWSLLTDADKTYITVKGWDSAIRDVGIAGIKDFTRVKCLHCHYAHYLSKPEANNIIGKWVHEDLRKYDETNANVAQSIIDESINSSTSNTSHSGSSRAN